MQTTTEEDAHELPAPATGAAALHGHRRLLAVLATPGARGLLAARALGSLPMGMVPLGIILAVRAAGGGYALAGVADGAYALGVAGMQPLLGRLIDRAGMTAVLAPLAAIFPAMCAGLAVSAAAGAPGALTVMLALLAGAALPPVGPCMRSLWPTLIASPSLSATAFAIDATLQELAFIAGPPLLALIVALADPRTALFAAAGGGGAGAAAFAWRVRERHSGGHRGGGALRSAGVRRLLAMSVLLGGAFGATEVAMPAFCELHGSRATSGLLLAALALGSASGGVIFGSRAARVPAQRRLLTALAGYALLAAPLLFAPSIPLMALCVYVNGMPIAPAFAGSYLLLDGFSVRGAITETFAWNTTFIFVGASLGTAVGGALIGPGGYRASIALSLALAAAAALLIARHARAGRLDG